MKESAIIDRCSGTHGLSVRRTRWLRAKIKFIAFGAEGPLHAYHRLVGRPLRGNVMKLNLENVISLGLLHKDEHTLPVYALVDHSAVPGLTKWLDSHGVGWTSLFQDSKDEGRA